MISRSVLLIALSVCATLTYGQSGTYADLLAKAHAGDAQAAYSLGKMYENPKTAGSPPDLKGAAYWYTQASNSGVTEATDDLARFYLTGLGVPRDDTKAFELYERAAKSGYASAMTRLAEMMIAKNYNGNGEYYGQPWIDKAADLGEPDALNDQGWLILNRLGSGIAPPVRHALPYFEKAAQAGSCNALFNLGNIYLHGSYEYHFAQDAVKAQGYFARARTCPSVSPDLKQQAFELEQRISRGELPPLSREQHAMTQSEKDIVTWAATMAAIAGLAKVMHFGENYGPNSQACWNVRNGLGGFQGSCICYSTHCE